MAPRAVPTTEAAACLQAKQGSFLAVANPSAMSVTTGHVGLEAHTGDVPACLVHLDARNAETNRNAAPRSCPALYYLPCN
jgi:hypothetical protein